MITDETVETLRNTPVGVIVVIEGVGVVKVEIDPNIDCVRCALDGRCPHDCTPLTKHFCCAAEGRPDCEYVNFVLQENLK